MRAHVFSYWRSKSLHYHSESSENYYWDVTLINFQSLRTPAKLRLYSIR